MLPAAREMTEKNVQGEERAIIHSSGKPKLLPKIEWSEQRLGVMLQDDNNSI